MKEYTDKEYACLQVLRKGVELWGNNGWSIDTLAKNAGVSKSTVLRLANGDTKWPQFHTVISILEAMNVELVTYRRNG